MSSENDVLFLSGVFKNGRLVGEVQIELYNLVWLYRLNDWETY